MEPIPAVEWLEANMIPAYPLGEIKNTLNAASKKEMAA
jgi:hypothetical protein